MSEAASVAAGRERDATGFLASFGAALSRFYRSLRTRRRVARMTDLDESVLDDIGVTRTDLYDVLDMPFSQNPSLELERRAQLNRAKWRRGY